MRQIKPHRAYVIMALNQIADEEKYVRTISVVKRVIDNIEAVYTSLPEELHHWIHAGIRSDCTSLYNVKNHKGVTEWFTVKMKDYLHHVRRSEAVWQDYLRQRSIMLEHNEQCKVSIRALDNYAVQYKDIMQDNPSMTFGEAEKTLQAREG